MKVKDLNAQLAKLKEEQKSEIEKIHHDYKLTVANIKATYGTVFQPCFMSVLSLMMIGKWKSEIFLKQKSAKRKGIFNFLRARLNRKHY